MLATCILESLAVGVNIPKAISTSHSQPTKATTTTISLSSLILLVPIESTSAHTSEQEKPEEEVEP